MDTTGRVTAHYGNDHLAERIFAALSEHGVDIEHLTVDDLAGLDQLHAGGAPAAAYVVEQLHLSETARLLDVGSGIGGPARLAAETTLCRVRGVDLTSEFVDCARILTARVRLAERVKFAVTSGDSLPLQDREMDAAMMIHVGMNVPDKSAVFAEVHRVLKPGGRFLVYDQMRRGDGALPYPMPWAVDAQSSFVETASAYAEHLTDAGFTLEATEDRTAAASGPPPAEALTPAVVFGAEFVQRLRNNVAATRAGTLAAVLITARA